MNDDEERPREIKEMLEKIQRESDELLERTEDDEYVPLEEIFPTVSGAAEASTRECGGFFDGEVDIETRTVSVEEPHDSSDAIFLDVWGEYGECSATMDIYLSEEEAHKLVIHLLKSLLSLKQEGDSSE